MAFLNKYGISTTADEGDMEYLEDGIAVGAASVIVPPPQTFPVEFPTPYFCDDHTSNFDGAPYTVWHWDEGLLLAHIQALRQYCSAVKSASVYIRTIKPDMSGWDTYSAIMHWPDKPAENKRMGWFFAGFEIEFTDLEAVA